MDSPRVVKSYSPNTYKNTLDGTTDRHMDGYYRSVSCKSILNLPHSRNKEIAELGLYKCSIKNVSFEHLKYQK